jgi:hypothetical protein
VRFPHRGARGVQLLSTPSPDGFREAATSGLSAEWEPWVLRVSRPPDVQGWWSSKSNKHETTDPAQEAAQIRDHLQKQVVPAKEGEHGD